MGAGCHAAMCAHPQSAMILGPPLCLLLPQRRPQHRPCSSRQAWMGCLQQQSSQEGSSLLRSRWGRALPLL